VYKSEISLKMGVHSRALIKAEPL